MVVCRTVDTQYIQACIFMLQCKGGPLFWAKGGEVEFLVVIMITWFDFFLHAPNFGEKREETHDGVEVPISELSGSFSVVDFGGFWW